MIPDRFSSSRVSVQLDTPGLPVAVAADARHLRSPGRWWLNSTSLMPFYQGPVDHFEPALVARLTFSCRAC